MDPFVQFYINRKKYKTRSIQDGGKTPIWNEKLQIPYNTINDSIVMTCYDEDIMMDDFVGEAEYKVSDFMDA